MRERKHRENELLIKFEYSVALHVYLFMQRILYLILTSTSLAGCFTNKSTSIQYYFKFTYYFVFQNNYEEFKLLISNMHSNNKMVFLSGNFALIIQNVMLCYITISLNLISKSPHNEIILHIGWLMLKRRSTNIFSSLVITLWLIF